MYIVSNGDKVLFVNLHR